MNAFTRDVAAVPVLCQHLGAPQTTFAQACVAEGSLWCSPPLYLSPRAQRGASPNASHAGAAGSVESPRCRARPGPKPCEMYSGHDECLAGRWELCRQCVERCCCHVTPDSLLMGFAVPGGFCLGHSLVKQILQGSRDALEVWEEKSLAMCMESCYMRSCPLMFLALSPAPHR